MKDSNARRYEVGGWLFSQIRRINVSMCISDLFSIVFEELFSGVCFSAEHTQSFRSSFRTRPPEKRKKESKNIQKNQKDFSLQLNLYLVENY